MFHFIYIYKYWHLVKSGQDTLLISQLDFQNLKRKMVFATKLLSNPLNLSTTTTTKYPLQISKDTCP